MNAGDSYIVLATEKEEDSLKHHIHFWLGSDTSQVDVWYPSYIKQEKMILDTSVPKFFLEHWHELSVQSICTIDICIEALVALFSPKSLFSGVLPSIHFIASSIIKTKRTPRNLCQ